MFRTAFVRSPQARRVLGAAALCAGVYVVAGALRGEAPREVEVTVSLGDIGRPVRAVELTFARNGEAIRSLRRSYGPDAPTNFRAVTALPEGRLRATVTVTLDALVIERTTELSVVAGEGLRVPAPTAP